MRTPVVWAPQWATNFAEFVIQSLAPLLSVLLPSGEGKFGWDSWSNAAFILHLDGVPLPQYITDLLRPFVGGADDAIEELSVAGARGLCGACYERAWICSFDHIGMDYTNLREFEGGKLQGRMLRRGLLHLRIGVHEFYRRGFAEIERPKNSSAMAVGLIQRMAQELQGHDPWRVAGKQSRQIVNLKELVEALRNHSFFPQVEQGPIM